MLFTVLLTVEGLNAYRVVDKLAREKIAVRSAVPQKNAITLEVARKDCKKVFAILRGSCYNVEKVSLRGASLWLERGKRAAGLLVGLALAVVCVAAFQTRVLKVRVVGSGAYYEGNVNEILQECGVSRFSAFPSDAAEITTKILTLPRVSYCQIDMHGGVVTVEIQVSDESAALSSEPLCAPVSGVVETLVVVRGTPLVCVGEEVTVGQKLVDCRAVYGERETAVIVVAYARIAFSVSAVYEGSEEKALAQAYLEYGELYGKETEQVSGGYRVTGTAHCDASCNLD